MDSKTRGIIPRTESQVPNHMTPKAEYIQCRRPDETDNECPTDITGKCCGVENELSSPLTPKKSYRIEAAAWHQTWNTKPSSLTWIQSWQVGEP